MSGLSPKDITNFGLGGHQTRESMEAYIARWLPLLGMHTWKVRIIWEKPIRGKHHAEIVVSDKLKSAAMVLNPLYEQWTDYWAETAIIHELLHCLHKATDLVWEKTTGLTDLPGFEPLLHPEVAPSAE